MRFRKFLKTIQNRSIFIIVFVVVVELLLAAAIHFWMPQRYEATATLLVSHTAEELNSENAELDSRLLKTYRQIAYSDAVLNKAAESAGINLSADQMRQRARVSNARGTNLVNIRVWSNVPEISASLANSLATALTEEIHNQFRIDNLQVVDPAIPPKAPSRMHIFVILGAGLLLSLLISILIVWLTDVFDDTLRNPEQVQDVFGRPVIGQIPHGMTRMRKR